MIAQKYNIISVLFDFNYIVRLTIFTHVLYTIKAI